MARFVVGCNDNEGIVPTAFGINPPDDGFDTLVKVVHFLDKATRFVGVGCPVNCAAFNHNEEAVGVFVKNIQSGESHFLKGWDGLGERHDIRVGKNISGTALLERIIDLQETKDAIRGFAFCEGMEFGAGLDECPGVCAAACRTIFQSCPGFLADILVGWLLCLPAVGIIKGVARAHNTIDGVIVDHIIGDLGEIAPCTVVDNEAGGSGIIEEDGSDYACGFAELFGTLRKIQNRSAPGIEAEGFVTGFDAGSHSGCGGGGIGCALIDVIEAAPSKVGVI